APRVGRKAPDDASAGIRLAGRAGSPSTRTTWQPTPSGEAPAAVAACGACREVAIRVAEVRAPAAPSSRMERLTPGARPRSSALRMSLVTKSQSTQGGGFSGKLVELKGLAAGRIYGARTGASRSSGCFLLKSGAVSSVG